MRAGVFAMSSAVIWPHPDVRFGWMRPVSAVEARGHTGELVDEVERKLSARIQQSIDGVYADMLIRDSAAEGDGEALT